MDGDGSGSGDGDDVIRVYLELSGLEATQNRPTSADRYIKRKLGGSLVQRFLWYKHTKREINRPNL